MKEHSFIEKAVFVIVVGFLAQKFVYPIINGLWSKVFGA